MALDPDDPLTCPHSAPSYRVQHITLGWSEWRPIDQPIRESHILSLQVNSAVTKELYERFIGPQLT